MKSELKKINLIYATQTGTSYDLAKQFYLKNHLKHQINKFIDIAEIQQFASEQNDCLWIFFISTTGQGDFPYSMRNLWKKMLIKSFPLLKFMKFTIYSFGDRSYGDNFCMAARKFRQRLIGLQAQEVVEIGLGDEQQPNGYFQVYRDKWYPNLLKYLSLQMNSNHNQIQQNPKISSLSTNFTQVDQKISKIVIKNKKQICSNKGRRTFIIDVKILNYSNNIYSGDILNIYPHNDPQDVKFLLSLFKLSSNDIFEGKLTYQQLFESYLNISSTLNHSFFIERTDLPNLSEYCDNEMFKEKLVQLEQDYEEYHNYIKKYKRNVVEVLKDFQIIRLPVSEFIQRCSNIIPRKYSISQILSNGKNKIVRVLFRLVTDKINQNRLHKGLCSHDLALWTKTCSQRKAIILKGQFEFTQKPINNLILISLGTGIAPFIQLFDNAKMSKNDWNIQLFYTNRYQNQVYFQEFLEELVTQNKLNPFLSFTGEGGKRIIRLVEDNIKEIQKSIQRSNSDFKIMICGPKQVCEGVQNILSRHLLINFKDLRKKKMFIYENW